LVKQIAAPNPGLAARSGGEALGVHRRRRVCLGLLLAAAFGFRLSVCGEDNLLSETNLIPEHMSLWTESMLWSQQLSVSSGVGYDNNVLLSPYAPKGSGMVVNGLDYLVMRLPLDGWQIEGAVNGNYTQFWQDPGVGSEYFFLASVKVQRDFMGSGKSGLEVRGLAEKQVLDISTLPTSPATALVEGGSLTLRPFAREDWIGGGWLQAALPVTRWWLALPLDDYWDFGPEVTAGYAANRQSEITLTYSVSYEDHDDWTTVEYPDGQDSPGYEGTKLKIFQQKVDAVWRQYWDDHQRWRSATDLIFADLQDNGSGYFNQYQYQIIQDLRWQTADWLIKGSVDLTYEDYPVQEIILGGPTLNRYLWDASAEMEHRIYRGLRLFAKCDYQHCRSNEEESAGNYNSTTVTGGVRWEF
jgi:hypothetical protein